jgi:hypothetical protein
VPGARTAHFQPAATFRVSIEAGKRRAFAQSCDWPGWCWWGKDEQAAVVALVAYSDRFAEVVRRTGGSFMAPGIGAIEVVERLRGGPVTDYGALTQSIVSDRNALTAAYRDRIAGLLEAAWAEFDEEYARVPAGERGIKPKVGRSPGGFRLHLFETDAWHLSALGGSYRKPCPEGLADEAKVRALLLEGVRGLPLGAPFEPFKRHGLEWTPVFAARRSISHALDHAWQLEDQRLGVKLNDLHQPG